MYTTKFCENKNEWNDFLIKTAKNASGVPNVTFIQSFEWMDFQESLGREVFPIAIYKDEEIVGVCAAVFINAKRGKYIYVRNGPVIDWTNKELVETLFKDLKSLAKVKKAWFIRLSPLIEKESLEEKEFKKLNGVPCPMHDVEALDTWVSDISGTEEDILKNTKKGTRYIIKKALKDKSLSVEISKSAEDTGKFYEVLKETVKRQKWSAYSFEYIKKEVESFSKSDKCFFVFVNRKDSEGGKKKTIAAGVFINFANQTFYHYGASLSEFNNIGGAYLMIWEAIKLAKSENNKFFNFWGIAPENKKHHPWSGLTNFKKKFYGFEQRWTHSLDLPISKLYWLTHTLERIDKYRKGY